MAKAAFFEYLVSSRRTVPPGHCGFIFANGFSGGGGGSISYGTGGGAGGGGVARYEQNVVDVFPLSSSFIAIGEGGAGTGDYNGGTGQNDYSWDGTASQYATWYLINRTHATYDDDPRHGGGGAQNGGSSHYGVPGEGNEVNPAVGGGGAAGSPYGFDGSTGNSTAFYGGGAGGAKGTGVSYIYGAGGGGGGGVRGPGGAGAPACKSGQSAYGVSAAANTGAGGGAGTQAPGGNGGSGYMTDVDAPVGGASQIFTATSSYWTAPPGYSGPVLVTSLDSQGLTESAMFIVAAGQQYEVLPHAATASFGGNPVAVPWQGNYTSTMTHLRVTWWPGLIAHQVLNGSGWWKSPPGNRGPVLLFNQTGQSNFDYQSGGGITFGKLTHPYSNNPQTFNGVIPYNVGANANCAYTSTTGSIIIAWFP